jgi:hypothetical protein
MSKICRRGQCQASGTSRSTTVAYFCSNTIARLSGMADYSFTRRRADSSTLGRVLLFLVVSASSMACRFTFHSRMSNR